VGDRGALAGTVVAALDAPPPVVPCATAGHGVDIGIKSCCQDARLGLKELAKPLQKSINGSIHAETWIGERTGLAKKRAAASGGELVATSPGGNRTDAQQTAQAEQRTSWLELTGQ
jgi:hypothetical protein